MTTASLDPGPLARTENPQSAADPRSPILIVGLIATGALMIAAGLALRGSSWILPDGLLGGGVAMVVVSVVARGGLDVIVALSPFMFYTLSPVGGILTVGSSDVILPVVVGAMIIAGVVGTQVPDRLQGRLPDRLPGLGAAAPTLLIVSVITVAASTTVWTIASPDYLLKRAVADAIKLGIGVTYFMTVYLLARNGGIKGVMRSFSIWAWTATFLSLGSLAGITGAVEIVPSDGSRSNGYFEDPNLYAGYLLVSLSVLLFLATMERAPWLPFQAVVIVGGIVTTGSRAGMASLVLLLVLALTIINSGRLRATIVGLSLAVAAGTIWLLGRQDGGSSILGVGRLVSASDNVGEDARLPLWKLGLEKWLDHPVFGIGIGQFERFSVDAGGRRLRSTGLGLVTHNTFLFFLVSFGVIGLALFVGLILWLVQRLYTTTLSRPAKHALFSGIVVLSSQMMTLNLQNLRYVWIYFGLVLGLSVLMSAEAEAEADQPAEIA